MTLYLSHFDTKLKQDLKVQEPIKNSMAEYFFPEVKFALGEINPEKVEFKDLGTYQGMSLQLASGKRMYFADKPIRDEIYPNSSDGAAYGSLLFTPCQKFSELKKMRVLVVDDSTGENNGILPQEEAKRLVGDCYGKISPTLAQQLTDKNNAPFQFRLGIKPQEENSVNRIGKGTLAPDARLETLTSTVRKIEGKSKVGYDIVLPTSSFKGRKGADAIRPGEYLLDVGIGVKSVAEYGKQSLGPQVLVNYPKGVKEDLLPFLEKRAEYLADIQKDTYALAQQFIKTYEERAKFQAEVLSDTEEGIPSLDALDFLEAESDEGSNINQEKNLYDLLKKDLEHHGQLLEHPYVVGELQKFLQNQWKDLALGRAIKFQSALAQPNLDLKEDEVCVPRMPDGIELIVTRSPLVNSNGVIVLKNRHLPELMRIDGSIYINPDTAAKHLQADFDGDRLAFERAERYPNLTAEIKDSLLPENRYPDVVKRDKVPYKGSFEEIAVSAVQNDIGKIANQIMSAVSLRHETELMPEEHKKGYVEKVAKYCQRLLATDADTENHFNIPANYREDITTISQLSPNPSPEKIEETLQTMRDIQFKIVSDLSNELQVAVDGPKSALRPQQSLITACKTIGGYQPVKWLAGKKDKFVYLNKSLETSNYSPVDLMVKGANEKWQENPLVFRPVVQFRPLFAETNNPQIVPKVQEIKETYNGYLRLARSLEDLKNQYPELIDPYLEAQVSNGEKIYITRLERFGTLESNLSTSEKPLNLKFVKNTIAPDIPNTQLAVATIDVEGKAEEKTIGAVAFSPEENLSTFSVQAKVNLRSGITQERIEGIYKELDNYVQALRQEHPDTERQSLASGLWDSSHTKDEYGTKKAILAFKVFPDEVIKQVEKLRFTELKVIGLQFPTNEYVSKKWVGEEVDCEIALHPIPDKDGQLEDKRSIKVAGKVLAPLSSESPSLPVGTTFKAFITSDPSTAVIATTPKGNAVTIKQIKNFAYPNTQWQGDDEKITVAMVKHKGREIALVTLNGSGLGILDKKDETKLKEMKLLSSDKSFTFSVKLQSSPSTAANIQVKPNTVLYPWQQKDKEMEMEQKRVFYREQYETYLKEFANQPKFAKASRKEIDVHVAARAIADTQNKKQVMGILSQSDTVQEWKQSVPTSRTWEDFSKQARDYVQTIQNEANRRLKAKCVEATLLLLLAFSC